MKSAPFSARNARRLGVLRLRSSRHKSAFVTVLGPALSSFADRSIRYPQPDAFGRLDLTCHFREGARLRRAGLPGAPCCAKLPSCVTFTSNDAGLNGKVGVPPLGRNGTCQTIPTKQYLIRRSFSPRWAKGRPSLNFARTRLSSRRATWRARSSIFKKVGSRLLSYPIKARKPWSAF